MRDFVASWERRFRGGGEDNFMGQLVEIKTDKQGRKLRGIVMDKQETEDGAVQYTVLMNNGTGRKVYYESDIELIKKKDGFLLGKLVRVKDSDEEGIVYDEEKNKKEHTCWVKILLSKKEGEVLTYLDFEDEINVKKETRLAILPAKLLEELPEKEEVEFTKTHQTIKWYDVPKNLSPEQRALVLKTVRDSDDRFRKGDDSLVKIQVSPYGYDPGHVNAIRVTVSSEKPEIGVVSEERILKYPVLDQNHTNVIMGPDVKDLSHQTSDMPLEEFQTTFGRPGT